MLDLKRISMPPALYGSGWISCMKISESGVSWGITVPSALDML